MKKVYLLVFMFVALCTGFLCGFSYHGSSNLSYGGYPSFYKSKPSSPYTRDEYNARRYKQEVESYIEEAKNFLEAADNDIASIQDEKRKIVNSVNQVIDEYNRWVNYSY
jgi:hypothetical protein pcarcW_17775|nr:MAG TPA: protein of unknown function (DUF4972) [Caudoviricetes sp.]